MDTAEQIAEKLYGCLACIREKTDFTPKLALVLGSGLGDYVESMEVVTTVDYDEIEGFPVSTVAGHKGRFIFGYVENAPVVCMQGRVHYYEGYAMSDVVLPIRLMKLLGAKALFLTNAAGGICEDFHAGDLMLIEDQISSFVPSPLIGPNLEGLGERFPDMTQIYDKEWSALIRIAAISLGIRLRRGIYVQMQGPNYESPAEIVMCRRLGADAVGMSTACEAIAAKHMGMRIVGLSLITNPAAGIVQAPLSHAEVQKSADAAAPKFRELVTKSIGVIASGL